MGKTVGSTQGMIAGMDPQLDPETYVFATMTGALPATLVPLATITEAEGLSVIVTAEQAKQTGLTTDHPMRRITLSVYSALDGVGLTAAVATVLADNGIACNMVAGFHHDHADRATQLLQARADGAKT